MAGIRRTWDKELYAAKARERLERGDNEDNETVKTTKQSLKEEFKAADKDADGPMGSQRAYLNSRQGKLDLESKVGKVQIVKPGEANTSHGAGYWCEVCQCLQKDSVSYLDHINGKKHQRALGYSMRVERVGADKVKDRLDALKRKVGDLKTCVSIPHVSAIDEYETKLADRAIDEELLKKKRKEEQLLRKREKQSIEMEHIDPDIAEMMGFGGFSTKKKL